MKKLLMFALLALPAGAYCQGLEESPDGKGGKAEAADLSEPVQRPDSGKIMSELSTALRLSSKQEERISAAVRKKTALFDKMMKEFDRNSAEEKKWRYKMNANRYEMVKLNRELPDAIREFLDDEQRQGYDEMLEARKPAAPELKPEPAAEEGAPRPVKKKRLIKRKKAAAAVRGEDEAGEVMVDKEAGAQPGKKKRVLKRKPAPSEDEGPAGAAPTGKEAAPAEEDAGSYP